MNMNDFGANVKSIRKSKHVSQAELAKAIGVHTGTVSHWENGRQMPDTATMQRVAEFLGVPMGTLWDGTSPEQSGCTIDSEAELDELVSQLRALSEESLQIIAPAIRAVYAVEHKKQ